MAEHNEREDDIPKTGELIRTPPPLPLAVPTGQQKTLRRILSRLSIWPFSNRRYVETLKTAKEVFDARSELGEAIVKHDEIRDRLKHFGTVLERNQEQRDRELFEEKERRRAAENIFTFEEKMQDDKNQIEMEKIKRQQKEQDLEKMAQEERELLLKKKLDELRKPPEPPPKKRTTRAQSEKQKRIADAHKHHESEITRIEKMKVSAKAKTDLEKTAQNELEKEIHKIEQEP